MIKQILSLLSSSERRRSLRVVLSVFVRALLDFAGVAALIPILIMVMGDNPDRRRALLLCCAILGFVLVKNALVVVLSRYQSRFLLGINKRLSYAMFTHYYNRGLLFLKSKSSVQLGYEVNFICYFFSLNVLAPMLRMASEAMLLLLIVGALVWFAPLAGALLCLAFLPLLTLYAVAVKGRMNRYGKEELEARRKQSRLVVEAFRGYSELEISQAFRSSLSQFDSGLDKINACRLRYETLQILPSLLSEAAIVIGLALLLLVGDGDLRIVSGVFAIAAYRMIPAARNLLGAWTSIQNASHAIQTVADGISDTCNDPTTEAVAPLHLHNSLSTSDLTFAYPDGQAILQSINIEIRKGERIGIRGVSGSGKSTLFNLFLGFFAPTRGEVRVDGTPLTEANRSAWHKIVGYVPQEIFIIQGSLADNIALGQRTINRQKVELVLEQVQLKAWADELPQGIDTPLGEYGSRLSGGQKQRIGIARALYKEAEVFFFDEATSALDNRTEQEINEAMESLSNMHSELTLIIIAHRESSLRFCDRIIDLDELHPINQKL